MAQSYFFNHNLNTILTDFVGLLYPRLCAGCSEVLLSHENAICSYCSYELPYTLYNSYRENPVEKLFWFKTHLTFASSVFFFSKGSRIQHIIHAFKYHNQPEVAEKMGTYIGQSVQDSPFYPLVDFIIPIPLHPKKQKIRGYNQSEKLALGMNTILKTQISTTHVVRVESSSTQTNKALYDRWDNVKDIFTVHHPQDFIHKHVLLVDDVITSGATIEAVVKHLQPIEGIQISVVSLAIARG